MGTLLEDLVARIFAKKTGLKVWPMPVMYRHPDHPCMLADIDRLVMLPKGEVDPPRLIAIVVVVPCLRFVVQGHNRLAVIFPLNAG